MCLRPMGSDNQSNSAHRYAMARHLAMKHCFLTKVVVQKGLEEQWVEVADKSKRMQREREILLNSYSS